MSEITSGLVRLLLACGICCAAAAVEAAQVHAAPAKSDAAAAAPTPEAGGKPKLDKTGRPRVGKASFYAPHFSGRKMANGRHMDPQGDNAASKTLPLGTVATVTNRETGQSAVVTIQDRGPYVPGRIVDLSPSTARKIGISDQKGVAPVEVAPLALPKADAAEAALPPARPTAGR